LYEYDQLSRRTSLSYNNNTCISYDYEDKTADDNVSDNLEGVTNTYAESVTNIFDYTYDRVGNALTMTADGSQYEYDYNNLYELKTVGSGDDAAYDYDKLGNHLLCNIDK
jgi:hypothetical protein